MKHCKQFISMILMAINLNSFAAEQKFILTNHFSKSLKITVGINPEVLPDMPNHLNSGETIQVKVADLQKKAYVRAEDNEKHFAFFGIQVKDDLVDVSGYLSQGIAFRWDNKQFIFYSPK